MESIVVERDLTVQNERGLHLSSAAQIARESQKYDSTITLKKGEKTANAKSVLTITALLAPKGSVLTVIAEGADAAQAVDALEDLFKNRFGENA